MGDWSRFDEIELAPAEAFYNDLSAQHIKNEDYPHAKTVWDHFKIRTLGTYHDFYVRLDVLLLADVFMNFRNLCLAYYKLDPWHMYTAAGLAWQSWLKMTDVKMELLTDPDKYLFFERGIRRGICMISKRYSRSNNKYMTGYKKAEASKYIMYLVANNLYGCANGAISSDWNFPIAHRKWNFHNRRDEHCRWFRWRLSFFCKYTCSSGIPQSHEWLPFDNRKLRDYSWHGIGVY